ncbi:MAG: MFS transporter [Clostridiales bacterium 38-18]|nr:MAG: MFS transporter [Clostridiales bacterium 38-18]
MENFNLSVSEKTALNKNITKNYFFTFIQSVDLTRGIWMIYLASKGMSLTQLGILETIFHITSLTMEVPTGAVADLYGRRVSRIVGRICSVISVMLLLFSHSFVGYAISFIITALSYNMESGAGDALVYDSMKAVGRENEYMKVGGNKEMIFQLANVVSFLAGGYLATKSYPLAFAVTIVIGLFTVIYAFGFKEPPLAPKLLSDSNQTNELNQTTESSETTESNQITESHQKTELLENEDTKERYSMYKQLTESLKILKGHRRLMFLILFSQFLMSFTTTVFFYLQNYMKGDGYSEFTIGSVYAVTGVLGAILAPQVFRIEAVIKEKGILVAMPIIIALSTWGIALAKYHFLFYIPISLAEGLIFVAQGDYINKVIPSEKRATLLSMASMVFSFFMITLFPIVGILGDYMTLKGAFMVMAILGTTLTFINTVYQMWGKRVE